LVCDMKRCLILGVVIAGLAVLLLHWRGREGNAPNPPDAAPEAPALAAGADTARDVPKPAGGNGAGPAGQGPVATNEIDEKQRLLGPEAMRVRNETQNVPVAFHGLVVDQDTNALANVTVDLEVTELHYGTFPEVTGKTTPLQRQTGADGHFEVTGLKGHSVTIKRFTKEGYEPELFQKNYGEYGPQSTSFDNPVVLRMWSTNLHEPLITGEKSFVIIPDGRHYGIDLIKGTMAEGDEGDLVAWVKRPDPVRRGQRYDWSCELMVPAGGLREESDLVMSTAPESGYTNMFGFQEAAGINGWGGATGDERFYVRLRNGQMYGRIIINLYADYHGRKPGMIRLSYAVNPSGSRLLR